MLGRGEAVTGKENEGGFRAASNIYFLCRSRGGCVGVCVCLSICVSVYVSVCVCVCVLVTSISCAGEGVCVCLCVYTCAQSCLTLCNPMDYMDSIWKNSLSFIHLEYMYFLDCIL